MKKNITRLLAFLFSIFSCSAFADTLDIINALTREYGKVVLNRDFNQSSNGGEREFSFTSKYGDINKAFEIISGNRGYIKSATVTGANENVASVTVLADFTTTLKQDENKIALFIEAVNDRHIPWPRSEEALLAEAKKRSMFAKKKIRNELTVTSISTEFGDNVIVKGSTYQSQAVFKELFVTINNIPALSAPFFERGTYYDVSDGRKMDYTISCRWGQKSVKPAENK